MIVMFRTYGTLKHKGKLLSVRRIGTGPYQSVYFSILERGVTRLFCLSHVAAEDRAYMLEALAAEEYYQAKREGL